MKTKLLPILRYIVLALLLLCIVLCRFFPVMAEGYACHIYPWLSAALSAIASVFPFSLEEVLVVVIILWMIIYPFLKRRKKKSWRFIVGREVELLAWENQTEQKKEPSSEPPKKASIREKLHRYQQESRQQPKRSVKKKSMDRER